MPVALGRGKEVAVGMVRSRRSFTDVAVDLSGDPTYCTAVEWWAAAECREDEEDMEKRSAPRQ